MRKPTSKKVPNNSVEFVDAMGEGAMEDRQKT
jgi:hypothetical protein